jgi:hypothetical protein
MMQAATMKEAMASCSLQTVNWNHACVAPVQLDPKLAAAALLLLPLMLWQWPSV